MLVYLNKHDKEGKIIGREKVKAEIIKENEKTVIVKLDNGDIIKRKKKDIVNG